MGVFFCWRFFPFRWVPYGWFPILSLQSPTLKSQAMVHVVEETGLSGWRLLELEKRYFSIATYSGKRSFTFSYNCRKGRFFYGKILESWVFFFFFNPLILMSDQDRNSPHNINTKLRSQVMRTKKSINWGIISWSNNKFLVVKSEELYSRL